MNKIKSGTLVYDRWWPEWGSGVIRQISPRRWRVGFARGALVYDAAHLQFLSPWS